jgi:hypothetical protein
MARKQPRILDARPIELMIVADVTGDGDPRNTASSLRRRTRGACEFVDRYTGRHYIGDRLPEHGERPEYVPEHHIGRARHG